MRRSEVSRVTEVAVAPTHYPLIYTYTAWVASHKVPLRDGWPVAALVFLAAVAIAYACLKWYDEPVRAWLKKKVLVELE